MKTASFAALLATMATQAPADCDLFCIAIYSVDVENCACVPIEWMECHPQYTEDGCNQKQLDISSGRDPDLNPYKTEEWYKKSILIESDEEISTKKENENETSTSDKAEFTYLLGT